MAHNPYSALKPVESSMFSRAGYDDTTWQLLLEFKSTHEIRAYSNVSPEVADEVLSSESLGRYFNANIKGNGSWSFETLGADPATMLPKAPKAVPDGGITDEDIQAVDSSWTGTTILSTDHIAPIYGGIDRSQTTIPAPQIPGDQNFRCGTGEMGVLYWSKQSGDPEVLPDMHEASAAEMVVEVYSTSQSEPGFFAQEFEAQAELATQPRGEVLGAWQTPKTAVEAVALLNERETEIDAIIAQSVEANTNALKVKVVDAGTHAVAGDVLTRLVQRKDSAFKLLDPFRAILHTAYKFAGSRAAAAIDPLDTAITHVKRQMGAWEQEEERKRLARIQEERRRAEEAARELQRQQQEALTLAEVTDALEQGDEDRAQNLFENPIDVPLPYVAPQFVEPTYLPPAGQSVRANWKIREETIDMVAFLRAVKDGKLTIEVAAKYVLPNLPALNKQAKSLENAFSVPGFEAFNDPVRSVRRGK